MQERMGGGLGRRDWLKLGAAGLAGAGLAGAGLVRPARAADAMAALEAAAKKEGELNIIAVPRDWANYGAILDGFTQKYGIKINDANPNGSSAQELQAIRSLKHQKRGPDAVDVGPAFAVIGKQQNLFAPYKVATWDSIPDELKDPDGYWYGDYFGVISFAVNKSASKTVPQSWADLKKPEYKGMVALNGSPLGAAAAFNAVLAAAVANGGSYDNIEPGVAFFAELAKIGNYVPVTALTATVVSGQTPIAINWDYLNLAQKKEGAGKADIVVQVPEGAAPVGGYYCQAISKYAPNPNAAKLWQEYLYSDEGQLLFLAGYAHPARFNALAAAHKVPDALMQALPPAQAYKDVKFPSLAQTSKAQKALADLWPKMVKT